MNKLDHPIPVIDDYSWKQAYRALKNSVIFEFKGRSYAIHSDCLKVWDKDLLKYRQIHAWYFLENKFNNILNHLEVSYEHRFPRWYDKWLGLWRLMFNEQ